MAVSIYAVLVDVLFVPAAPSKSNSLDKETPDGRLHEDLDKHQNRKSWLNLVMYRFQVIKERIMFT